MNTVCMHCDTISALYEKRKGGSDATLFSNDLHVDIGKLKKGNYLLQNFALFVKYDCENPWEKTLALLELYKKEIEANKAYIAPVLSYKDILKNQKDGKISSMLTVEEGGVTGGDLSRLMYLYENGVRLITVSWNFENGLSHPNLYARKARTLKENAAGLSEKEQAAAVLAYLNTPDTEHGLTKQGILFVEEMERLGMLVDVSHISDRGFYDVLAHTKKPFVASHSNARAICPCVRNMTDDMIRKLSERGGVMGLNFCADFLTQLTPGVKNPGTIEAIVRHAKHIMNAGGEDCIGIGSDFDGIDTHEELPGADHMGKLWDALAAEGIHERQLDKIFSENVLRVYKEVL